MALVLAGAVAGCGGPSVTTEGDVTLLVHGGALLPRGGDDAQIVGTVAVRNGCVGLAAEGQPDRVLAAIWPSGTRLDGVDPVRLRLPSGTLVDQGTAIRGGGGYHAPDSAEVGLQIPAACHLDTAEVVVFNPDDDPAIVG